MSLSLILLFVVGVVVTFVIIWSVHNGKIRLAIGIYISFIVLLFGVSLTNTSDDELVYVGREVHRVQLVTNVFYARDITRVNLFDMTDNVRIDSVKVQSHCEPIYRVGEEFNIEVIILETPDGKRVVEPVFNEYVCKRYIRGKGLVPPPVLK